MKRVALVLTIPALVVALAGLTLALGVVRGVGGDGRDDNRGAAARRDATTAGRDEEPAPPPSGPGKASTHDEKGEVAPGEAGAAAKPSGAFRLRPVDSTVHALPDDRFPPT